MNFSGIKTLSLTITLAACFSVHAKTVNKPVLELDYTKDELSYGKYMNSIHRSLQKNSIDWFSLKKILALGPKPKLYGDVHEQFVSLQKIAKAKVTVAEYESSCGAYLKSSHSLESYAIRLKEGVESYCRRYLWKVLNKEKNVLASATLKSHLEETLPFALMGEHSDMLEDFLKAYSNGADRITLSEMINEIAAKKEIIPNKDVIELIDISPKLSMLLQKKSGHLLKAASLFKNELRRLLREGDSALEAEDFKKALSIYKQAFNFQMQNQNYLSRDDIWKTAILRGKDFFYKGELQAANDLFEMALEVSDHESREETLFQMILVRVATNRYKDVLKLSEKYDLLENVSTYGSRIGFWLAYSLDQVGEKTLATHLFKTIAKTRDVSYYSILSRKFINSPTQISAAKKDESFLSAKDVSSLPADLQKLAKRINIWSALGASDFLTLEIGDALESIESPDQNRKFLIALGDLFNTQGNFLETFKLLHSHIYRGDIEPRKSEYDLLFPTPFYGDIKENARGIDPLVILSLVRQESAFNPRAMSPVGARGLMQLMPATARRFSRGVRTSALLNPQTNIKIATKYLRKLLEMYDGNLVYTLAAYNAGENRVKRWRKDVFISDNPLIQVELIPYKETRNYVKLIYRNIHFYQHLLEQEVPKLSLEDSFKVSFNQI